MSIMEEDVAPLTSTSLEQILERAQQEEKELRQRLGAILSSIPCLQSEMNLISERRRTRGVDRENLEYAVKVARKDHGSASMQAKVSRGTSEAQHAEEMKEAAQARLKAAEHALFQFDIESTASEAADAARYEELQITHGLKAKEREQVQSELDAVQEVIASTHAKLGEERLRAAVLAIESMQVQCREHLRQADEIAQAVKFAQKKELGRLGAWPDQQRELLHSSLIDTPVSRVLDAFQNYLEVLPRELADNQQDMNVLDDLCRPQSLLDVLYFMHIEVASMLSGNNAYTNWHERIDRVKQLQEQYRDRWVEEQMRARS